MTSMNRTMMIAVLAHAAFGLAVCASLGIHDTQSLLLPSFHRSEIVGFVAR